MHRDEQVKEINAWLHSIANDLSLDEEGICSMQCGTDTIISLELSPDMPILHLYSSLLPFPVDDKDGSIALALRALQLNAFQVHTRGGAIASVPGWLIFCYSLSLEGCDGETFSACLNDFIETVFEVKEALVVSEVPKEN